MIFISAGHHKKKKGAKYKEIFNEFDEALLWQKAILRYMPSHLGIAVPGGNLKDKIKFINDELKSLSSSIAVEIHFNSAKNSYGTHVGRGSETLYCPKSKKGRDIAEILQLDLGNVFGPTRGIKEGYYQMNPEKGPDAFLSKTKCPAIIIEPDFVHNYKKIREGKEAGCKVIALSLIKAVNNV